MTLDFVNTGSSKAEASRTDNVSRTCIYNWIPARQMVKMPKKNVNVFDTAKDVRLCMKKVKGRGERPAPEKSLLEDRSYSVTAR